MGTWDAEKARLYMRKKREERRKLGLCTSCGKPAVKDRVTCKACTLLCIEGNRRRSLVSFPPHKIDDLLGELWKPVVGYEGIYEVSNFGRVKSLVRVGGRGSKIRTTLLSVDESKKYLFVRLSKNSKTYNRRIHRLVALAFLANPLNLPFVNHKDGDTYNNSVSNLEWVTDAQNKLHASQHGLIGGEKARTAKLTIQQVKEIRLAYPQINGTVLAKIYNVTDTAIYRILSRKTWKYI